MDESTRQPSILGAMNAMTDEQVDTLIESAQTILRADPGYQKLVKALNQDSGGRGER